MLYTFLDEITKNIEDALEKFQKDNDIKSFSNSVKINFGNIFSANQIEEFTKMNTKSLTKKILDTFNEKRDEINQIENENESITAPEWSCRRFAQQL